MTNPKLNRLLTLQILGAAAGSAVSLLACFTLVWSATTGQMPVFATGLMPVVLITLAAGLGCWICAETVELK